MSHRRDIRRLAMQVLYQIDLRGQADAPVIRQTLDDGPDGPPVRQPAFDLALAAWGTHPAADTLAGELAPQWPTHRQPPVDRAILRLAYYEMVSGYSPVKVAINEAVELAKHFGSENSSAFINGVLDRMAKRITPAPGSAAPPAATPPAAAPPRDAWLDDATSKGESPGTNDEPSANPQ